jgi:putative phosphoesterase
MKIGIISDTHDHIGNLQKVLLSLRAQGVNTILHCGDISSPQIVHYLKSFDVWFAQGNTDYYSILDDTIDQTFGKSRLAWLHRLTFDGYSLALSHGDNDEVLSSLILSGEYAYVLHGHTHRSRNEVIGRTRVINPGAIGGTYRGRRSFCILDLESGLPYFSYLTPNGGL